MQVKSKEKDIYEKFYDWFKEIFDIEDDEEEIEKVIIYTNNKNRYVLQFEDNDN